MGLTVFAGVGWLRAFGVVCLIAGAVATFNLAAVSDGDAAGYDVGRAGTPVDPVHALTGSQPHGEAPSRG